MELTRRSALAVSAAGGGLLVAWWLYPRTYTSPLEPVEGEYAFGAWLKIGKDGVVSVAVPQLEMGQGVTTLIPQIVAMELGADWRQIAVEPAPVSAVYANAELAANWAPLWDGADTGISEGVDSYLATRFAERSRFTATADGTSLKAYEEPCRFAAASTRTMLAQAAAERWGVSWEECSVADGLVRHEDRTASFGELASEAANFSPPHPPPLRTVPPREEPLPTSAEARTAFPRLDLPSKVDGSYQFAGDVRLPGMVYAAIRHGPVDKAELTGFDAAAARQAEGYVGAVEGKRWLAAIATNWWAADQALRAMKPQFEGEFPVSSDDIDGRIDAVLRGGPSFRIAERGFGDEGLSRVDIARRYDVEAAAPLPLETASATARYSDGQLELWIAAQAPELARKAAARAIGIATEDVVLYPMPAGGSFDRRLEHDHAIEIALIAYETGRPVQLVWSRREDILRTRPRLPAGIMLGAQLSKDGEGRIEALRTRIACPPGNVEFGKRLFENFTSWAAIRETSGEKDVLACEGAMPPYAIPAVTVQHAPVEIGLPVGRMRGNAHSYTAFATESFIDEVAHDNDREPLSFRIEMLGEDLRLAACLQRAARMAEWDGGRDQSGQGLACHRIGDAKTGGRIACVATARPSAGGVRVNQISVAVDLGRIVNLDLARQQIEGGLIFGLGVALGEGMRYRAGLPTRLDIAEMNLPLLADCPSIGIEFIASEADPVDPGELGAIIVAPAIANALFSATGLRLRRLPLLSSGF